MDAKHLNITRRDLLRISAASAVGMAVFPHLSSAAAEAPAIDFSDRYVTCFYQFNREALEAFTASNRLPNGPGYTHVMSHSAPRKEGFSGRGKMVHDCGPSYKWAPAFDLFSYEDWQTADDRALKGIAKEYRDRVLDPKEGADYFAFNEMPLETWADEKVRGQVTKLVRYLHDIGDGGPKRRGIFYLSESNNMDLSVWKGSPNEFFQAIDETCDLLVAEHYHTDSYIHARTPEQFTKHMDAMARAMDKISNPHAKNLARKKFCILHSCYWGSGKMPGHKLTPWGGMVAPDHDPQEFEAYLHHCIAATRASEFGRKRMAFSPLCLKPGELDEKVYSMVAEALAHDMRKQQA